MMDNPVFSELFQVAEIEVSYRNPTPYQDRIKVKGTHIAYEIFNCTWDKDKIELVEQFKVLLLNQDNGCLGIVNLTMGIINFCPFDPRLIFGTALKANATAIVLAHNHPSGNLNPSTNDIASTKKIVQAAKLLGISVMDHLVITPQGYYSFLQHGILPK
jgi:DNA repair protein RadC